ncbi:MAG: hypothetical protein LC795_06320 [Acidobacteria bacterium]|nr:hypothetical protein [Acidobacteriota bacterium]
MRKLLVCAALALVAAAGAAGQEGAAPRAGAPPSALLEDAGAEAARLLRARGSRERAWGAYLAGAYGLKEHAPLVVALLEDADGAAGGWEESSVKRAALDALIRLDADVPPEKLLPLYQLAPDETVILLAHAPERNAGALLTLFADEMPSARWVAVGNLLAEALAKGFAARLLAGLEMRASVYVYDREGERGFNGGGGHGCGGSSHFALVPDGFPPFGRYALTTTPLRGAVVVARGRHTVYYVRAGPGRGLAADSGCEVERDAFRVEYLAELLRTTAERFELEARSFHEVVCRDERQCRRALADLRDEAARAYAAVLGSLVGAELLGADEASGLKPDLTLVLYDYRERKTFPLPEMLDGVKIELVGGGANADEPGDTPPPTARL